MMRPRKLQGKKADSKGRLVIKPRKAGEKVPRKLVLRDGTRLDVLIEERRMQNVVVEKMITEWQKSHNPHHSVFHAKPQYLRAECYLPDNYEERLKVIDVNEIRFITGAGMNHLCLVKMPISAIKRLPKYERWFNDMANPDVYRIEPSIRLRSFFERHKWKDFLKLWLTENLDKDWRMVEAFKTFVIPLIPENWKNDSELSKLQFFNNHMFWVTNTKAGKSEWAKIIGETPSNEWSLAGFLGGYEKGERFDGKLEGYGCVFVDEAMYVTGYSDISLVPALLTYIQQGSASRTLKMPVETRGTKTLIFASNPTDSNDVLSSFENFLKVLAGNDYPDKVGSRCGLVLVGNDYKTVKPSGNISEYRGFVLRLIKQILQKYYYSRIYPILKTNMQWACETDELEHTYDAIIGSCPSDLVAKFISGMKLAIPKIKMGCVRSLILENLDSIVVGFNRKKFQKEIIVRNREQRLLDLVSINMQSFANLSLDIGSEENDENKCLKIRKKFPNLPVRDIGLFLGVPKSNVDRWLKKKK